MADFIQGCEATSGRSKEKRRWTFPPRLPDAWDSAVKKVCSYIKFFIKYSEQRTKNKRYSPKERSISVLLLFGRKIHNCVL